MSTFLREAAAGIEAAGIATYATDLWIGPMASIPTTGDGPYFLLKSTPGMPPEATHNDTDFPGFERPGVQVTVIAKTKTNAEGAARDVYNFFYSVRNQFLGETWYLSLRPTQEPFDFPADKMNRAVVGFNAIALKLPTMGGSDIVGYYLLDDLGGDRTGFKRPAVPDTYEVGVGFEKLVPGSSPVAPTTIPIGTIAFEASARVEAAGARAKVALFNLLTDQPVSGGVLTFSTSETDGETQRSGALVLSAGVTYGAKITTDDSSIGAAAWNIRLLHL